MGESFSSWFQVCEDAWDVFVLENRLDVHSLMVAFSRAGYVQFGSFRMAHGHHHCFQTGGIVSHGVQIL